MFFDNTAWENNHNTIIVTGRGRVTAVPDLAKIRLGVITTGENLSDIQNENAETSNLILNGLRNMGVNDIRTYQYIIDRNFEFIDNTRVDRGYTIRNVYEIQTGMPDNVGAIIDTAVSLGANLVESITFEVSAAETFYLEALKIALMNGAEKAAAMAEVFNARLSPVPIRIIESGTPVPLSRTFLREDIVTTPVEPGTTQIEAIVTMEFGYN